MSWQQNMVPRIGSCSRHYLQRIDKVAIEFLTCCKSSSLCFTSIACICSLNSSLSASLSASLFCSSTLSASSNFLLFSATTVQVVLSNCQLQLEAFGFFNQLLLRKHEPAVPIELAVLFLFEVSPSIQGHEVWLICILQFPWRLMW